MMRFCKWQIGTRKSGACDREASHKQTTKAPTGEVHHRHLCDFHWEELQTIREREMGK